MTQEFITINRIENKIAMIYLNRPDKHNAMHGIMMTELLEALRGFRKNLPRVLIIQGNGKNFCAGGDIAWMKKMSALSEEENKKDAELLADLLYELYTFPIPTMVLAQGVSLGGGLGLLAAADIVIAADDANFGFPEVKIGIVPFVVSPYVIAAIGKRNAHYYFLTGERFQSKEALRIGLIHKMAEPDRLLDTGMMIAKNIIQNGSYALSRAKTWIDEVANQVITPSLSHQTALELANIRKSPEAEEGLCSFLEKRKPKWYTT